MKRKAYRAYLRLLFGACLILIFGLTGISPLQASTFGGRAYSAFVNIPSLGAGPVYISDTGELSPGGWQSAALSDTSIPTVLSAGVLVAATVGATYVTTGDKADSSTSLADLVVLPGNPAQITASFVRAQTQVTASGVNGYSEIYDLTFGGVTVAVTGQANQTVTIPGVATLTINEQATSSGAITVNALHLVLLGGGEVIVSSARSSIF
jgi:hypothetical protein